MWGQSTWGRAMECKSLSWNLSGTGRCKRHPVCPFLQLIPFISYGRGFLQIALQKICILHRNIVAQMKRKWRKVQTGQHLVTEPSGSNWNNNNKMMQKHVSKINMRVRKSRLDRGIFIVIEDYKTKSEFVEFVDSYLFFSLVCFECCLLILCVFGLNCFAFGNWKAWLPPAPFPACTLFFQTLWHVWFIFIWVLSKSRLIHSFIHAKLRTFQLPFPSTVISICCSEQTRNFIVCVTAALSKSLMESLGGSNAAVVSLHHPFPGQGNPAN